MDYQAKGMQGITKLIAKMLAIGTEQEIRNGCRVCSAKLIDDNDRPLPGASLVYLQGKLDRVPVAVCKEHTPDERTTGVHIQEILDSE